MMYPAASSRLLPMYASLTIVNADNPDTWVYPLSTGAGQRTLFSLGQGSGSLVAVLGAIGLTSEFRHRTATATFLATPRRSRVVAAKLVTFPLLGAAYGLACVVVTVAIALPWLSANGIEVSLVANGIPGTLAGVVAGSALFGLVGVGVGALLRDQVGAVVVLLVYLFVAADRAARHARRGRMGHPAAPDRHQRCRVREACHSAVTSEVRPLPGEITFVHSGPLVSRDGTVQVPAPESGGHDDSCARRGSGPRDNRCCQRVRGAGHCRQDRGQPGPVSAPTARS
jgi:hypothetical protein